MRSNLRITWRQISSVVLSLLVLSAIWIQPARAQSQDTRLQDIQQLKDKLEQFAIATTSLISGNNADDKWNKILDFYGRVAGESCPLLKRFTNLRRPQTPESALRMSTSGLETFASSAVTLQSPDRSGYVRDGDAQSNGARHSKEVPTTDSQSPSTCPCAEYREVPHELPRCASLFGFSFYY